MSTPSAILSQRYVGTAIHSGAGDVSVAVVDLPDRQGAEGAVVRLVRVRIGATGERALSIRLGLRSAARLIEYIEAAIAIAWPEHAPALPGAAHDADDATEPVGGKPASAHRGRGTRGPAEPRRPGQPRGKVAP